jgi:hypothetical protein
MSLLGEGVGIGLFPRFTLTEIKTNSHCLPASLGILLHANKFKL